MLTKHISIYKELIFLLLNLYEVFIFLAYYDLQSFDLYEVNLFWFKYDQKKSS
jgi:hypothetical protein